MRLRSQESTDGASIASLSTKSTTHSTAYRKARNKSRQHLAQSKLVMQNNTSANANTNSANQNHHSSIPKINTDTNSPKNAPTCTESQTVLLCLDYLRSLRRNHQVETELVEMEGIQEDYVTLAIWALSRSFVNPEELVHKEDSDDESDTDVKSASNSNNGNDPYFQQELANASSKSHSMKSPKPVAYFTEEITIPTLQQMNDEILYHSNPHDNGASNSSWYKYDDQHYSNKHRFYKCDGLDNSPLELPQIIIKGLESMFV